MSDVSPPKAQSEHEWLQQLVGEWTWESDAPGEPGKEIQKHTGSEVVRSLNGIWIVAEGRGTSPDSAPSTTIMTLGYSPERNKYVGTFVASMMTDLWLYEGWLEADRNALVLDTEGPSFPDMSRRSKYKDTIRIIDGNNRVLTSQYQDESGHWNEFMTARYRRSR